MSVILKTGRMNVCSIRTHSEDIKLDEAYQFYILSDFMILNLQL